MSIRTRLRKLESQQRMPQVYPQCAIYSRENQLQRVYLSDGSQLTGQEATKGLTGGFHSFPIKTYVGFDPSICIKPSREIV
jgi:hypothetical protein